MGGPVAVLMAVGIAAARFPADTVTLLLEGIPVLDLSAAAVSTLDGGAEPFFGVVDAFRMDDGRIAVADRGASAIRLFLPGGSEDARAGRRGQGPGEFQGIASAGPMPGDSLWGYDFSGGLLHVFGPDGAVARSVRLDFPSGVPFQSLTGPAGDIWVGRAGTVVAAGQAEGLRRDTVDVFAVAADGSAGRRLARQPGNEQLVRIRSGASGTTVSKALMPFSYSTVDAVSGQIWLTVQTEDYLLRLQNLATDDAPRWVRIDVPTTRVDDRLVRAYASAASEGDRDREGSIRRAMERMPLHEAAPEIEGIAPSREGGFWVGRFTPPGAATTEWVAHRPDGTPVGRFLLPAGLRVRHAGPGWVLATTIDELGVERVVLLEDERIGSAGSASST